SRFPWGAELHAGAIRRNPRWSVLTGRFILKCLKTGTSSTLKRALETVRCALNIRNRALCCRRSARLHALPGEPRNERHKKTCPSRPCLHFHPCACLLAIASARECRLQWQCIDKLRDIPICDGLCQL